VDPVANGDGERPSSGLIAEEIVSHGRDLIDLAVAAGEKILQGLGGKILRRRLCRAFANLIKVAGDFNEIDSAETNGADGEMNSRAAISEVIQILIGYQVAAFIAIDVLDRELFFIQKAAIHGRVQAKKRHHGSGGGEMKLNIEFTFNAHRRYSSVRCELADEMKFR
jgi:hypothetical protein